MQLQQLFVDVILKAKSFISMDSSLHTYNSLMLEAGRSSAQSRLCTHSKRLFIPIYVNAVRHSKSIPMIPSPASGHPIHSSIHPSPETLSFEEVEENQKRCGIAIAERSRGEGEITRA